MRVPYYFIAYGEKESDFIEILIISFESNVEDSYAESKIFDQINKGLIKSQGKVNFNITKEEQIVFKDKYNGKYYELNLFEPTLNTNYFSKVLYFIDRNGDAVYGIKYTFSENLADYEYEFDDILQSFSARVRNNPRGLMRRNPQ